MFECLRFSQPKRCPVLMGLFIERCPIKAMRLPYIVQYVILLKYIFFY